MKFSTSKSSKIIKSMYWLIFFFVGGFYVFNYVVSLSPIVDGKEMIMITSLLAILLGFWYMRARYFEYDSNGSVLIFVNRGVLLQSLINYRETKAEFPKEKLRKYRIKNYLIYRPLYIYVKSKNGGVKKVVFDITFVSPKRVSLLEQSLNKVITNNKQVA